jgi:release factor H-coupled RctB family protein
VNNTINKFSVISHPKNWMEYHAINQLKSLASLPGVTQAVGLPDLHPGRVPVGVALITKGIIYPHIIGNDIGCGMGLYATGIDASKARVDRWARDLARSGVFRRSRGMLEQGSIGGGNHFAELQAIDTVYDTEQLSQTGINPDELVVLVHSGSRALGQSVLKELMNDQSIFQGLKSNSKAAKTYLKNHNAAVEWAVENRFQIARRLLSSVGKTTDPVTILDTVHNSLTVMNDWGELFYIHRKGAATANAGAVVIPGSRGALTYLVQPTENIAASAYSLAHGAGRKWQRGVCKARLSKQYTRDELRINRYKGQVVCHDLDLLYEEAPEAYKNIDYVVQALVDAGLARVIATFKPLLTVKG